MACSHEGRLDALEQNNTWKLVDLPHGHHPVGLRWVFKLKNNETGAVVKHKARLIAKGYVQQPGVDSNEVFASVAPLVSVRLLISLAEEGVI